MSREPACSTCGPGIGNFPGVVFAVRNKETGEYLFSGRTYKTRSAASNSLGRFISYCLERPRCEVSKKDWELVKLRLVIDESEDNWS